MDTYKEKLFYDGLAYVEEKYPNLIFLKDGERYTIEGKRFLVIGGGYSKDFFERVLRGYGYWYDEELSDWEFQEIADTIAEKQEKLYILSHMLPIKWSPDGAKRGRLRDGDAGQENRDMAADPGRYHRNQYDPMARRPLSQGRRGGAI